MLVKCIAACTHVWWWSKPIYLCVNLPQTERNTSVYSGAKVSGTNRCRSVRTLRHYSLVPKCLGAEVSWSRSVPRAFNYSTTNGGGHSKTYRHRTVGGVNGWAERRCLYCECLCHQCLYFNRFPVIQPVSSKVCHFSTFFAHFGLPWVRPWDNRGKCHTVGKRIQCLYNTSLHVPIYLQSFLR